MKHVFMLLLIGCYLQPKAQQSTPIAMEDPEMSAFLAARKPVKLTILLKNLPDTFSRVEVKCTMVSLGNGFQYTRYAAIDKSGRTEVQLDQDIPFQQVWLSIGDYLYAGIYVNKGLTITLDLPKLPQDGAYMIAEGVTYSGEDGMLNTVMNKNVLFKKKERQDLTSQFDELCHNRKKYDQATFSCKIDSLRKKIEQFDDEFTSTYPAYAWAVKNETASELLGDLCVAYWNDPMPESLFKQISAHKPFFTSNNGALFYRYLNTYTRWYERIPRPDWLERTLVLSDSLYSRQKADIGKLFLLESTQDEFAKTYPLIINTIKTAWCKKIAADEFAKATATQRRVDSLFSLSKKIEEAKIGTPLVQLPFEANLYQLDTVADINQFILNLRSKFANKALIIDCWATWCMPCLADLPFSKALHEQNKDLPVEYIYLCTSSSSNTTLWKNKIASMMIPGTHIFCNEKMLSSFMKTFNGSGFPTYVVIDAKGNVKTKAITRMQSLDRAGLMNAVGL